MVSPESMDKELVELREELRELERSISKVRKKRKYLEGRSAKLSAQRQKIRQVYLFVGRVEQAIENVRSSRNVGDLRKQVNELAKKIAALKKELDPRAQKARLSQAVESVSSKIREYAQYLKLEHANANIRLNIKELSLEFGQLSGRKGFKRIPEDSGDTILNY